MDAATAKGEETRIYVAGDEGIIKVCWCIMVGPLVGIPIIYIAVKGHRKIF